MPDFAISREQELFCECVSLNPTDRIAWLDDVCGSDQEMRRRVERLIEAHESAEKLTVETSWGDTVPEFIDGYRIVRAVGEGGMGIVYEAQQEEPIRRRVAIKAVKPGMDMRQVIARFRAERQALAAMDHPYVAKVFDAGQMPSGRPYFVMEFVHGVPLLQYCDTHSLTVRQRIELFVSICQAVQHAHHKGVIHRDLKPGNVLVTSEFDTPMPKIIDFGIARAVSPEERAGITQTAMDLRVGTPAYMSPEQAGRGGLDVDTRTDVYSLGVILYELLTGALPADPGESPIGDFLQRAASGELKVERPGSRTPLASDLDWIVLKAIEVDRDRRYETAIALAEDLQRYLDSKPVIARPPTLAYRASKFLRRNRVSVAAATVTLIAVLGGVTAGGIGLVRARDAEAAAKQDAEAAKQVSDFLVRLLSTPDPNLEPGAPVTVRHVLEEGTRRAQTELANLPETQARLLGTLSHVHHALGSYREAKLLAEQALAARPKVEDSETAEILLSLARANQRLDRFEEGIQAVRRALEIRVRLGAEEHRDTGTILNNLGSMYGQVERFDEAIAAHRRALAIQQKLFGPEHIATYNSWRGLGMVYDRQGDYPAALESFERIVPIARKRYGNEHPVIADAIQNVAMVLGRMNRLSEAQAMYEQGLAMNRRRLGANHPETAFSAQGVALMLRDQGKLKESIPYFEEALRIRMASVGPENVRTAETLQHLGGVRMRLGQVDEGLKLLSHATSVLEKRYGRDHSDVLDAYKDTGMALVKVGRYAAAIPYLQRVLAARPGAQVRLNLSDKAFDGMRARPEFRQLQASSPIR